MVRSEDMDMAGEDEDKILKGAKTNEMGRGGFEPPTHRCSLSADKSQKN